MKKIITISILTIGLITITNAQGITNTLGGNTANDKFIVENSDSEAGLVVTGEGKVGIGTTNPLAELSVGGDGTSFYTIIGFATDNYGIGVSGQATSNNGIGVSGFASGSNCRAIVANGSSYDFDAIGPGVNYGATSSIRWKRNIVEIDNPLEKLAELRGVYFDWDEEHGGGHDVGCIAEEVGKVLPEIVVYEENGIDANGMDYSKLTPLLIEAVKALQKRIEELEKR